MLVFVINLDRDKDRMARMIGEGERVGLTFKRFAAVDGHRLEADLRDQFFVGEQPHEPAFSPGEIGCYASHLRVHRLLEDLDGEYALVLEDDVRLADDLVATIDAAAKNAPDWDIIRLSNTPKAAVLPVAPLCNGRELVKFWTVPNGTGAYIINRTGAIKFAEAADRRTLPVDEDLRRPWRFGLNVYGVLPPPVEPDVLGKSTIVSMGRKHGEAASKRFKDAILLSDVLPQLRYRFAAFGPLAFFRALLLWPLASLVKRVWGRAAAQRFYRL